MNWYRRAQQKPSCENEPAGAQLAVFAKDVPLNWSAWHKKQMKHLKWIKKVLSLALDGNVHRAMLDFAGLVSKIRDEDRYYISQTEYGYMWDGNDVSLLFNSLESYADILDSVYFYIGDGDGKKALKSAEYADNYVEKLEWYQKGFVDARNAGYKTLREYAGEEGVQLSVDDLKRFAAASQKIAKWFGDFSDVEASRKSTVENLETMIEWGGQKGPEDRSKVDKLYHTTIAAADIEQNGFKADAEVKGLGGATDGMLSTTLSKKVAIGIADGLKGIIMLANGRTGMESIRARAKKAGVWDEMRTWNFGAMGMLKNLLKETGDENGGGGS